MNLTRILPLLLMVVPILLLPAAGDSPPMPASAETQADLSAAFFQRLKSNSEANPLVFDLFIPELDTAFISPDGETAVLWLALRDDSGRLLATEPGLVLAILTDQGWQVLLPGDQGWEETFNILPEEMLPVERSPAPTNIGSDSNVVNDPLTGYYLPYAAGTSRWLEGSISHFQYIPELGYPSCSEEYCRYAYDFTDAWHFPLLASKRGTVVAARDSCADGSPSCTNYIVLYNANHQAYQIYLHLSHGTIPNKLTAGTLVRRGEYLGDTDDTGYSTSQHVHFMVTDSIWMGSNGYYWGRSIDVRFEDVQINNGLPRTCYEITNFPIYDGATECLGDQSNPRDPANDWFVSGNPGAYPPTGILTRPTEGENVTIGSNLLLDVTAIASDDVRVTAVRLIAKLNNQWVEIGPLITQPAQPEVYDWDIDLCAVAPLNGPIEVALRVWDHEGNMAAALDPRTIQIDHACPPPTSQLKPAETFDSTAVNLSWEATSAGAEIGSFDLQWRTEPGLWDAAHTITVSGDSRATWFGGQGGASYAFRLRALDVNDQPEAWPEGDVFETNATLPASCIPDSFEPDDNLIQARVLPLGEWAQSNLCDTGNPDWFRVEIDIADDYFVTAPSQFGGAAVSITVYQEDGETIVASSQAAGVGQDAIVRFQAVIAGSYYIKIESLTPYLIGTEAFYGVRVSEVEDVFLPVVVR